MLQFKINRHDAIDSTNSEAWRLIDKNTLGKNILDNQISADKISANKISADKKTNSEGIVVIAKTQTHGRGQRENIWQSTVGGLYLSVALQPQIPAERAGQLTIWSAWGIAEALKTAVPNVRLKLLNDLMIENRKLGGILTETRILSGIITHAVVGVGINWLNEVPENGIALADLASNIADIDALEELVLSGIASGWSFWQEAGIEAILPKYLQLLSN